MPKFNFCYNFGQNANSSLSPYSIAINNIKDNPKSKIAKHILGRGPGSGKGKTSGRGHKGYTARTSEPARHFEGGQTPMTRRIPKRGFNRRGRIKTLYSYLNLSQIAYFINKGRLDHSKVITIKHLFDCGAVSKIRDGVKLLGGGGMNIAKFGALKIEVSDASAEAIKYVKDNGGEVQIKYRSALSLRCHAKPHKFLKEVLDPIPTAKKVKRLHHLEEKGAIVSYNKPDWLKNKLADPLVRMQILKKKLLKQRHANMLDYPINNEEGNGDNTIRKGRKVLFKRVSYETK